MGQSSQQDDTVEQPDKSVEPGPAQSQSQSDPSPVKSKLRSLVVAVGLGAAGYGLSILWVHPFETALRLPALQPTASTSILMSHIGVALGAISIGSLYFLLSDKGFEYIDLDIPKRAHLLKILVGALALLLVLYGISTLTPFFTDTEPAEHQIEQTIVYGSLDPRFLLLMMPLSVLIVGPAEEFIYRNLVQKRLYDGFSRPSAVALSSVIFTLAHFPTYSTGDLQQTLLSLSTVYILSLVLGTAYAWTENLIVPAGMHGLYNASLFGRAYLSLIGSL